MGGHSIIAPSSAAVWGSPHGCQGSVMMAAQVPAEDRGPSIYALEGSAAHEVAERMINAAAGRGGDLLKVGDVASNGTPIDQDMIDSATVYATDVIETMRELEFFDPRVEEHVKAPSVHELSAGTVDCYIYAPQAMRLTVWDFKHGFKPVEAEGNLQAVNYVAGIIDSLGLDGWDDQILTVEIRIAQPRAFHHAGPIRSWTVKGAELRGLIGQLRNCARVALSGEATTRAGVHCRYCKALHCCTAARDHGLAMFESIAEAVVSKMSISDTAAMYNIISDAVKYLEGLATSLGAELEGALRSGQSVAGWALRPGRGSTKWTQGTADIIALGELCGVDLSKPGTVTPKQAEKLGLDPTVLAAYTETTPGALKLKKINTEEARKIFSNK